MKVGLGLKIGRPKTAQPRWTMIKNLGDRSPIEYGGFFIYRDMTGQYEAEAEILDPIEENDKIARWEIRRFTLDRCTWIDGILSDNQFHPEMPAWFATPESERASRPQDTTYLADVARAAGIEDETELRDQLCSEIPVVRAVAYREIGNYHGWDNFDAYPRIIDKRSQLPRRIRRMPDRIE